MAVKRLLIIGGVAGGATAAARARRLDEDVEITVVERGPYVSYANCGLPYFVARDIQKRSDLLLQTPEGFDARYGVKVLVRTEALELDLAGKRVRVKGAGLPGRAEKSAELPEGEAWLGYDALILAQGGNPVRPPLPGVDAPHVFQLWTVPDTDRIHGHLEKEQPRTAAVVGGGFIGLEMAEALQRRGLDVTVVELLPTLLAVMDPELGRRVGRELEENGVRVLTGVGVKAIHAEAKTLELADGRTVPAELVLLSVGVRPELALARAAGLEVGPTGALLVDDRLRTSNPHVFAAGDMVEVQHRVSGRRARLPLAGPANRQGRIAATNALGGDQRYAGALGTSVVKVFEATAGMTGLTERAAREAGLDVGVAVIHKDHHAGYYPGAKELTLKLVYERKTARLLGGQAFGHAGVDKRIDVLATALAGELTLHDLAELDLAYAPPYSSANDPVNVAAMVGQNDLSGHGPLVTAAWLRQALGSARPPLLLDVRNPGEYERGHVAGARNLPLDDLRFEWEGLPRDRRIAVVDRNGFRSHLALRILKGKGFTDVVNVTGGMTSIEAEGGVAVEG
jgi:NADPH-dependent 2,4-dienoyl-CoA reductase/sulfur reductase-like enzyme/rhodanese-related sulfurtransferase